MMTFQSTLPLKVILQGTHLPLLPHLFTELSTTKDTELVQPDTFCNVATDHEDNLEEIQPYLI